MKFATFNVNSLKMRLPIVLDWLRTHQPDVLMLQELKGTDLPEMELTGAGYTPHAVPQKAYNGVMTLVRDPAAIVTRKALPGMEDDEHARFIEVTYPHKDNLIVINIYAPNGNPLGTDKYAYKLKWLHCLCDYLAGLRRESRDVLITGDFNIIPEAIDAAHPENWTGDALFQTEVRALYRRILYLGYTDVLRTLNPETHDLYSFWDYQAGSWQRNNGIRIDHVLVSPRLADRVIAAGIDRDPRALDKPSDHTPVWVDINL